MALTNTYVKNLKPSNKAAGEKHSDGHGLYLASNRMESGQCD